jgi:hypothetical protein
MLVSRSYPSAAALRPRISAPPRIVVARIIAVAALLLLFTAAVAIVMSASARSGLAPADAEFITARLVERDQGVRTRLVRLDTKGGVARAQHFMREAIASLSSLARPVRGAGGGDSARLAVAIADELRFLEAVRAVLWNPRSTMLRSLASLDVAARRSVAALPGPAARRKGGVRAHQRHEGVRPAAAAGA